MPTERTGDDFELHITPHGGYAAIYRNGKLVEYGDPDNRMEELLRILGVTYVIDDAFLLGTGGGARGTVAENLDEITAWRTARDAAIADAARMREEANRLIAQAAQIEQGIKDGVLKNVTEKENP